MARLCSLHLKSTIRDCGNVWKLLFLFIEVSESTAIRPNICRNTINVRRNHLNIVREIRGEGQGGERRGGEGTEEKGREGREGGGK